MDRETQISDIARLWVRWNARMITGDEFARRLEMILGKDTAIAWDTYIKGRKDKDPLRVLMV